MSTNGNSKTERCRVTVPEIDPVTMKPTGQRKEYGYVDLPVDVPEKHRDIESHAVTDRLGYVWQVPQKHSQLSAAQRAKLTDDMVAAIQEQRKQINVLTQAITNQRRVAEILDQRLAESQRLAWAQETQLNAHSSILQRPTLWGRLKWFWTGR